MGVGRGHHETHPDIVNGSNATVANVQIALERNSSQAAPTEP